MPTSLRSPSVVEFLSATAFAPTALYELGVSRHHVSALIATGRLLRLRRGRLAYAETAADLVHAARLGGRLDCVSLLGSIGVFVRAPDARLHVQFTAGSSRLPPHRHVQAHWRATRADKDRLAADLVEALVQSCRCQAPRDAVATLDSAWHQGLVDESDIAEVFALLPRRYRRLRPLLDPRAESGPETLMRLMLRALGCRVDVQVQIEGVGRVDLLVDGWLIVECDSRAHHSGWDAQKHDRRRDLAAAARGFTTVRPIAEDILGQTDAVIELMRAALAHPTTASRTA